MVAVGVCGVCGRSGRLARRATADSPAVGRCCYRPPVAVCSVCETSRPCYGAAGPSPVCLTCVKTQRQKRCVDCGQLAPAARRVPGGVICQPCDRRRGSNTARCGCGQTAPLVSGRCVACRLRRRVEELAAAADPDAARALAAFLAALAGSANAASMIRWTYTPGFGVCRRLLSGELEVSHAGLDRAAIDAPQAAAFLRAKLVDSGVLTVRDPQAASFAVWQQQATLRVPAGVDRAHVRAYATWQVAAELAGRARHGQIAYSSQKYARSLVTEAVNVVCWLHDQHLHLADLRQDLVDAWVLGGGSQRRRVRMFLRWLIRGGVIGALEVAWGQHPATRAAMSDDERLALLRRLLADEQLEASDRIAGCLLLLYAQPLTRIVTLTTSQLTITAAGNAEITLGRGAVKLPAALTDAARQVLARAASRVTDDRGWLFAGRHAGSHLSAEALGQRLARIGVGRAVSGRYGAMLALAGRLPAPILAQRIGHRSKPRRGVGAAGWRSLRRLRPHPPTPSRSFQRGLD